THTGVAGVRPHWRNLTDAQIKAVAETGGTIGIIFHAQFLRRHGGPRDAGMVAEHVAHVLRVAGEDYVSLGSDFDGAITPPPDLAGADRYPRLVQTLLERGMTETQVAKILGGNFLRAFELLRPGGVSGVRSRRSCGARSSGSAARCGWGGAGAPAAPPRGPHRRSCPDGPAATAVAA